MLHAQCSMLHAPCFSTVLDIASLLQTAEYRAPPAGWECAACGPPNPHVKPYGRYKRAMEAAEKERQQLEMLRSQVQRPYSSLF